MYIWTQLTENDLETLLSWRPGVHRGQDVSLPREVEYSLSLNLKFLFPQPTRNYVVWNWFNALVRKAKLAWIFRDQRHNDRKEGLPAVPFVKNPSWQPVVNHFWFRQGVEDGRRSLMTQITKPMPFSSTGRSDVFRRIVLSPFALESWLTRNSLLCFISDKNLGIVVTTRYWYETQVTKFMELPVFESFTGPWEPYCSEVWRQVSEHSRDTEGITYWISPKVQKFLEQAHDRKSIPQFHGIPKIHKNPWKIRPIVPMHSYVTSTLSIVLHHLLLPIQRSFPWICESSRDLCEEVRSFNRSGSNAIRIHTGDVTAMYTSIQWPHFKVALASVVHRHPDYRGNMALEAWIVKAAEILWKSTVFQAHNRLFHQTDGIPMGIHCGPVFANLYLAFYERQYLQDFDGLYRRYIDDAFALHQSDDVVSNLIRTPDLDIVWSHSEVGLPFLDVWFHTHLGSSEICFRPYEKVGNHHQYLPWDSSHPLSVKKGLVKGELTRAANISYLRPYFLTWKATLLSRLISRGWPRRAVWKWGRQVRWSGQRAALGTARSRAAGSIIAVSQYNPAWEKVSSTDIWSTMRETWSSLAPRGTDMPFPQHAMVAKKRTKSLWDVVRSGNRSQLRQQYEETTLEEVQSAVSSMDLDELPFAVPVPFQGVVR